MTITYKPVPSIAEMTDLYECQECGAPVLSQDIHTTWHENLVKHLKRASMIRVTTKIL